MTDLQPAASAAPLQRSAFANKNAELWKFADALSRSALLPKHFIGKPADVFLALQISEDMSLNLFAVTANLFVVHGTPAFSSKFLIGLANARGPFKGPLRFSITGRGTKDLAATCWAVVREDNERVEVTVTLRQAEEAGWTKNQKYREIPEQMLQYRAATFLVRLYCPEVTLMGARTVDEAEDIYASSVARDVDLETAAPQNPLRAELARGTTKSTAKAQPQREDEEKDLEEGTAVDGGGPRFPWGEDKEATDAG